MEKAMSLKELTKERHKEAESCEFNVRMMQGNLTKHEYLQYLGQLYMLFEHLDELAYFMMPPNVQGDFQRRYRILDDMREITDDISSITLVPSTVKYYMYLDTMVAEYDDIRAYGHIYLNYMALLYGGQFMKTKVPSSGELYNFYDKNDEIISAIRSIEPQINPDEVNLGYDFYIGMFNELQELSRQSSN